LKTIRIKTILIISLSKLIPKETKKEYSSLDVKETFTSFVFRPRIFAQLEVLPTFPLWHISLVYLKVQQFFDKSSLLNPRPGEGQPVGVGSPQGRDANDLLSMRSAGIKTLPGVAISLLTAFWPKRTVTSYGPGSTPCYRWKSRACHTNFSRFEFSFRLELGLGRWFRL